MLPENSCNSLCCSREQRPLAVILSSKKASWSVDIKLKRRIATFKMDTGAGNTSSWESLRKVIWGPIQTLDQFMWWLKYCKRSARQSVYVVKGLKTNLLGPVGHHCLTVVKKRAPTNHVYQSLLVIKKMCKHNRVHQIRFEIKSWSGLGRLLELNCLASFQGVSLERVLYQTSENFVV